MKKQIKIRLTKSLIARKQSHKACAIGLGLRKIGQEKIIQATPENLGMVNAIRYMLEVENTDVA
jgi:large subunit ribosomal protein L30